MLERPQSRSAGRAPALLALLLAASCGGSSDVSSSGATTQGGDTGQRLKPAAPIRNPAPPQDPSQLGSIRGRTLFVGEAPAMGTLSGPLKQAGCGEHDSPPRKESVVVEDGRLANVLVSLRRQDLHADAIPSPPEEPALLRQEGCLYRPHVLGIVAGQSLHVLNEDATDHNVHLKPKGTKETTGARLNRTQVPGSSPFVYAFDSERRAVPFECDLHPWMKAWVAILEHPYFCVTGPAGEFTIEGVPPGDYYVETWHETFGPQRERVQVPAAGEASLDFSFTP